MTFQPPVWNIGNVSGVTSSGRSPHAVIVFSEFHTIASCVMTVSFGIPVEPPVWRNRWASPGASSGPS